MFMKLEDGRVYCLPDGYEVEDRSLDPIRYVLNPTFAPDKVRLSSFFCDAYCYLSLLMRASAECMGDPGIHCWAVPDPSMRPSMHSHQRILQCRPAC